MQNNTENTEIPFNDLPKGDMMYAADIDLQKSLEKGEPVYEVSICRLYSYYWYDNDGCYAIDIEYDGGRRTGIKISDDEIKSGSVVYGNSVYATTMAAVTVGILRYFGELYKMKINKVEKLRKEIESLTEDMAKWNALMNKNMEIWKRTSGI